MENQNVQNEEIEIDLREVFMVLWSRIVLIVGVGCICAVAAGLLTKLCIVPMYQSTTKIYVLSKGDSSSASSGVTSALTSLTDLQLGSQVLIDYMAMMTCDDVLNNVIEKLELDMEPEELLSSISINNPDNTRILEITVTNEDPKIAKLIADAVADESAEICSENMQISEPSVYQYAKVADHQSSPNMKKNVAIAFIAGVFVIGIIVVVRYLLDDTIKSSEDIEKYLGINTLGLIPIEEGSMEQLRRDKRRRKKDMK